METTREQKMERQLRLMDFMDRFNGVAMKKGLYMDHTSDTWTLSGQKYIIFFVWDPTGSVNTSFTIQFDAGDTYTNEWMDLILDDYITAAFE